jgi:hypothetical protein
MERHSSKGINIWFWARNDASVPLEVKEVAKTIRSDSSWGPPDARFSPDSCDHKSYFDPHKFIFDTTFCVSLSDSLTSVCPDQFFRETGLAPHSVLQTVVLETATTVSSHEIVLYPL